VQETADIGPGVLDYAWNLLDGRRVLPELM